MQTAIDHQAFSLQTYGGVSRYFYELVNHLQPHIGVKLRVFYAANRFLEQHRFPHREFPANKDFKGKIPLLRKLNNPKSCQWLKQTDFDVFHPSYFHPYFLKCIGDKPFVLTVHDMTHELYPNEFSPFDKTPQWKKMLVKKAKRIIAVSENTRNDLIEMLNADADKIDVVYHGAPMQHLEPLNCRGFGLPEQYLLYIGARNTYKNFSTLAQAFAALKKFHKNLYLVVIGGGDFSRKEIKLQEELNVRQAIRKLSGGDALLSCAYRHAQAFVFPSRYEGFGLPVLEAFANNCPVVAANRSSLPEVGGEAVIYFNPDVSEALQVKLDKILQSNELRNELRRKGRERVQRFTWDKTARKTIAVYEKAIQKS